MRQSFSIICCLLVTVISFGVNSEAFSLWNYVDRSSSSILHRFARQAGCGIEEYTCANGQCVSTDNQCDGKQDCEDGSDETISCRDAVPCQEFAFRCTYGACVGGDARCNNIKDCLDGSDEENCSADGTTTDTSQCKPKEVQCNSGECIKRWHLCDGEANCKDGSDESVQKCAAIECPSYTYRCAYGACVDGDARCNGIKECADNSDEAKCPKRTTTTAKPTTAGTKTTSKKPSTPTTTAKSTPGSKKPTPTTTAASASSGCVLPAYPRNGRYNISGTTEDVAPGSKVADYTRIKFFCRKGNALVPNSEEFFCLGGGNWFPSGPFPECVATCSALISKTVQIKSCKRGEMSQDCSQPVLPGTIATLGCKPLYEYPGGRPPFKTIVCSDGSWDYSLNEYRCHPVCGKKVSKGAQTLIVGGAPATPGDYPWQIAVYRNNTERDHICGGSIITPKVVLSAAHCFTNLNNGDVYPKENYLIAAGKYYRPFDDARDTGKQVTTIKSLHVPERYKGLTRNYDSDIAVVVVDITFTLTVNIQPVCVDWDEEVSEQQLQSATGVVTGWGYTKEGKDPSEELKELQVPYVPFSTCFDNVPEDFRVYLTDDKMCAGFLNGSSVCQGDSGGPLVFKQGEKYFIRGIVSIGPIKESSCDSRQYGAYTKVSKYIEYITPIEALNRAT